MNLDFLQQNYNEAMRRGGADIDYVFSDFDSQRYYNKLLVADMRFMNKQQVPGDGTFSDKNKSYLEFAGVPWIPDQYAPTRVFMLDSSSWKKYVLSEFSWADESGSNMIAQTGSDAYEARLRLFCNVFAEKPAANAVMRNYISP